MAAERERVGGGSDRDEGGGIETKGQGGIEETVGKHVAVRRSCL